MTEWSPLDADLQAALERVGVNEDTLEAANWAQQYRNNPPTVLTAEEQIAAIMETNGVSYESRVGVDARWHFCIRKAHTPLRVLPPQANAYSAIQLVTPESTYAWSFGYGDFAERGYAGLIEQWARRVRAACVTLTGKFVMPDWQAYIERKKGPL